MEQNLMLPNPVMEQMKQNDYFYHFLLIYAFLPLVNILINLINNT